MSPEQELEALYAAIPRLDCKRLCQQSCGPIVMSRREWDRIEARRGIAHMYATAEDRRALRCPYLDAASGRCTVYAVRPLICRLWGVVKRMRCPWGCKPERWLSEKQARKLLRAVQRLSGEPERAPDMALWQAVQ